MWDYLLVGAGLFNSVFAYLAKRQGKRCLVIDKRKHLGGNVFCEQQDGICIHKYGPHIFHTDNESVWTFVNCLVPFRRFTLNTLACYEGRLYNLPFNMHTFYQMWGTITPREAMEKVRSQCATLENGAPHNLEEQAIKMVGTDIYATLIKGYTEKQWGRPCSELPPSIIKRIPLRFEYNNDYFSDRYQGIPQGGYYALIDALLSGIECKTETDYFEDRRYFDGFARKVVYSGPLDQFYDCEYGRLDYRSRRFEEERLESRSFQGNAIVNYTSASVPFTRIVEHKFFDIYNEELLNLPYTIITREYPLSYEAKNDAEPYYPVNDERNKKLYSKYEARARRETKHLFGGRLATYRYYDMDDVIESAMQLFDKEKLM